jgi:putative colanic acid biosynthesis UDP-glucose lipid carrier transferase
MCEANQIERLYLDLLDMNVDIVWLPDLSSRLLLNHTMTSIDGMPAVYLNESLITSYPLGAFFKALLDRSLALVLIVVLSPLLMITAVAVRLSSPGPVLFKQERHGLDGKVITIWKFRSMRLHDDPLVTQASRDDLRFTRVGRFIRRASIDELPQLFNVFQGRMSLVGPRPHAVVHSDYFMGKIDAYMARHRIKPGMTGLAQISGCRGAADSLEMMKKRVEFDLAYINRWSLLLDIKILIKTPFVLFSKDVY